jgi:hypothetical protein
MDFHPVSRPPRDLMYPMNKSKYTKHLTVVLKIMLTVSVVSQPKCAICYGCSMPILTVFNCFCYRSPRAPNLFAQRSYSRRRGQWHGAHSRDETQLELSSGGLTSQPTAPHSGGYKSYRFWEVLIALHGTPQNSVGHAKCPGFFQVINIGHF